MAENELITSLNTYLQIELSNTMTEKIIEEKQTNFSDEKIKKKRNKRHNGPHT